MNNQQLSALYKIRFSDSELPRKNAIWKIICQDFLQTFVSPSDTLLDIASGYGEFINNINCKRKISVDLNADTKDFLSKEIEFHNISATQISDLSSEGIDVIFTSNFLEHLPNKAVLDELLKESFKTLRPGGKFLILGPNLKYLAADYWDFYDHHLGLTHLSLCEALQLSGFSIDQCVDKFLPYTTQGSLPTHPLLVKIYLKVPVVWRILGKQFFIVARKPV
jgi:SAM-dependent methyltransferase